MSPTVFEPGAIPPAKEPTLYFIGVTTGSSSIMKVFPRWAEALGVSPTIVGIDIAPHSDPQIYRETVGFIKNDPLSYGALVTTHKLDLFQSCEDMFEAVSDSAALMREVSCISKHGGELCADAFDDVTAGLALEAFVPEDHFLKTEADMLILGAGGASLALTHYLDLRKKADGWGPNKVTVTNRSLRRLEEMDEFHRGLGSSLNLNLIHASKTKVNDDATRSLRQGSVVINGTGLGKDAPGSPLSENAIFPSHGFAWDFNYRGNLVFLDQARSQINTRKLTLEDGWVYFLHGWTRAIDRIFDVRIPTSGPEFDLLSQIAKTA